MKTQIVGLKVEGDNAERLAAALASGEGVEVYVMSADEFQSRGGSSGAGGTVSPLTEQVVRQAIAQLESLLHTKQ